MWLTSPPPNRKHSNSNQASGKKKDGVLRIGSPIVTPVPPSRRGRGCVPMFLLLRALLGRRTVHPRPPSSIHTTQTPQFTHTTHTTNTKPHTLSLSLSIHAPAGTETERDSGPRVAWAPRDGPAPTHRPWVKAVDELPPRPPPGFRILFHMLRGHSMGFVPVRSSVGVGDIPALGFAFLLRTMYTPVRVNAHFFSAL